MKEDIYFGRRDLRIRIDDIPCVTVGTMNINSALKELDRKLRRGRKRRKDGRPRPRAVGNTG